MGIFINMNNIKYYAVKVAFPVQKYLT